MEFVRVEHPAMPIFVVHHNLIVILDAACGGVNHTAPQVRLENLAAAPFVRAQIWAYGVDKEQKPLSAKATSLEKLNVS